LQSQRYQAQVIFAVIVNSRMLKIKCRFCDLYQFSVVRDKYDCDPLIGSRSRIGGSPHYLGKAGQVMQNIWKWALNTIPKLSQNCPVIK
jgi:hypothetical protein